MSKVAHIVSMYERLANYYISLSSPDLVQCVHSDSLTLRCGWFCGLFLAYCLHPTSPHLNSHASPAESALSTEGALVKSRCGVCALKSKEQRAKSKE